MPSSNVEYAIQTIVEALPDVAGIYIFGSAGTNFEKKDSDIDLAILTISPILPAFLWDLSQIIAVHLSKDVDLINLKDASTVFCFQIISDPGEQFRDNNGLPC